MRGLVISLCILLAGTSVSGRSIFKLKRLTHHNPEAIVDSTHLDSFFRSHAVDLCLSENRQLYLEIFRWYKTTYHYGGNNGRGIDCSHFVNKLYEKIYGRTLNSSSASIFLQCKTLKGGVKKAREGDLVFFKIKGKRISHVGLYLQNGLFVHATTQAGVIISDLQEDYYRKHFFKAGRIE